MKLEVRRFFVGCSECGKEQVIVMGSFGGFCCVGKWWRCRCGGVLGSLDMSREKELETEYRGFPQAVFVGAPELFPPWSPE